MTWKKVEIDKTVDHIILIQNSSIIPNSLVYLSFTTANTADENNTFMLTGPNQWEGRIKAGTNLFYAEEHGGEFTYSAFPIEKLENYNIPTEHKDIQAMRQSIICPEGSYFVIQNKDVTPFSISIVGEGQFILTENQMLSFTFANESTVVVHGTGQKASYMIAEAPSLTQLSKEVQDKLNEIFTSHKEVLKKVITREEFTKFKRKMECGKWSDAQTLNGFKISFKSDPFYESDWLNDKAVVDIIANIKYLDNGVEKHALLQCSINMIDADNIELLNYYSDDINIRQNLRKINFIYQNPVDIQTDSGVLEITGELDPAFIPMVQTTTSRIRTDNIKWKELETTVIAPTKTIILDVFRINEMITFSDEEFYQTKIIAKIDHKEADLFAKFMEYSDNFTIAFANDEYSLVSDSGNTFVKYNKLSKKLTAQFPTIPDLTRPICFNIINTKNPMQSYTINMLYSTSATDIVKGSPYTVCTYTMFENRFSAAIYDKFFKRLVDEAGTETKIYKLAFKY
jgi:hypothetical protein